MKSLAEQVLAGPVHAIDEDRCGYLLHRVLMLNKAGRYAEAEAFARRAIAYIPKDVRPGRARAIMCSGFVDALVAQGKLEDAAAAARLYLTEDRQVLGTFHPTSVAMVRTLGDVLTRSRRYAEADAVLSESIHQARAMLHGDDDTFASLLVALGRYRLARNRVEDGLPMLMEGAKMRLRLSGPTDSDGGEWFREGLLVTLGSKAQKPDGSLRAQVLCAIEELSRDEPGRVPHAGELRPSDVHYRVMSWNDPAHGVVADGTLNEAPHESELAPGFYLLGLDISTPRAGRLTQVMWLLVADWDVSYYAGNPGGERDPRKWARITGGAPARRESVQAVAFMNVLKNPPQEVQEHFAAVATTTLTLPAGRYRFEATSDEGLRLDVDGRRVIDSWFSHNPRRDFADVELDAGRHQVRAEYFEHGDRFVLWLRAQPRCDEASRLFTALGGRPPRTPQRAIEQEGQSTRARARAARGTVYVGLGRFKEAFDDYSAAVQLDAPEPLWRQQMAILALLQGNQPAYRQYRDVVLRDVEAAAQPETVARAALVALLSPGANAKQASAMLSARLRAHAPPASQQGICQLAQGVCAYRAGQYERAAALLAGAANGRLTPEAAAAATFFRALALDKAGPATDAAGLYRDALATMKQFPTPEQLELDLTEAQDRLVCLAARREAEAQIKAAPLLAPVELSSIPAPRAVFHGVVGPRVLSCLSLSGCEALIHFRHHPGVCRCSRRWAGLERSAGSSTSLSGIRQTHHRFCVMG